jgi:hypothetical protein
MKKINLFLLLSALAIVFFAVSGESKAQPCLKYFYVDDSTFRNPDSVMIDTCDTREDIDLIEKMWAKHYFRIECNYNIIPRNYIAPNDDTIIEYTWQDILPIYPQARAEFQALENRLGKFVIRDDNPGTADTTLAYKRSLLLLFDNCIKVTDAKDTIQAMTCIKDCGFISGISIFASVNEDNSGVSVYPNPANDEVIITMPKAIDIQNAPISLFDNLGNKITNFRTEYSDNQVKLNVSAIPSGRYEIRINNHFYSFIISR